MTEVFLIRHAQTDFNLYRRYSGATDVGLNETGRRQAAFLCQRMRHEQVDCIYASTLKRAVETASIAFPGRDILLEAGLREMDFGVFEGQGVDDLRDRYPDLYHQWMSDPFRTHIPQSEGLPAFSARVAGAVARIVALHAGKRVAIVSHGGSISVYLNTLLAAATESGPDFWKLIPHSASVSTVRFDGAHPTVRLIDDVAHLKELHG